MVQRVLQLVLERPQLRLRSERKLCCLETFDAAAFLHGGRNVFEGMLALQSVFKAQLYICAPKS